MKSVLLLEDEPGLAEVLVILLEAEQFKVIAVANGLEALDALKDDKPDVILTDVMMPLMSGPEFCQAVRADPVNSDIPIVFQTSVEEWAVREHFTDFDDYFLKPYDTARLLERLRVLAEYGRDQGSMSMAPKTNSSPVPDDLAASDLPPAVGSDPA